MVHKDRSIKGLHINFLADYKSIVKAGRPYSVSCDGEQYESDMRCYNYTCALIKRAKPKEIHTKGMFPQHRVDERRDRVEDYELEALMEIGLLPWREPSRRLKKI